MPLTQTLIVNAQPRAKTYRLFDGGGLNLEVSPRGGKWWRAKYQFGSRDKRLSLGVFPMVGLKLARLRCLELRSQLASGHDPSALRGFLFPSERATGRPMSDNTLNAALRRLGYGKSDMTAQGFRAIASTLLIELGWNGGMATPWNASSRTAKGMALELSTTMPSTCPSARK